MQRALELVREWRGRVWVCEGLPYAIDIVSTSYDRPKPLVKLETEGKVVYVELPEEAAQRDCIDWSYLRERLLHMRRK